MTEEIQVGRWSSKKKKSTVASFYTSHLWMLDLTGKVYTNDSGKWAQLAQTREHY